MAKHPNDNGPGTRDVRPQYTKKEAELVIRRCERETHYVQRRIDSEGRSPTSDERNNIRRYRHIVEETQKAIDKAEERR